MGRALVTLLASLAVSVAPAAGASPELEVPAPRTEAAEACADDHAVAADPIEARRCLHRVLAPPANASPAVSDAPPRVCVPVPGHNDRCEEWLEVYRDPAIPTDSAQFPTAIGQSPDGGVIYVAVQSGRADGWDSTATWVLLAYGAEGGDPLWTSRFGDPDGYSFPRGLAVSPDGATIFVTGNHRGSFSDIDGELTTIAFDAETGDHRWIAAYRGPGGGTDNGFHVAASPDGDAVYVVGVSDGEPRPDLDYVALAYDSATGDELWAARYAGVGKPGGVDTPLAGAAVSPDGALLYTAGWSAGPGEFQLDYATVAFHTRGEEAGTLAWEARYDGAGQGGPDRANGLALSADGTLYVTGLSYDAEGGPPFPVDYVVATVAYEAQTGEQRWEARRGWEGTNWNVGTAVAVSGDLVAVTGTSTSAGGDPDTDYLTIGYETETGAERWTARYGPPLHDLDLANSVAFSSDGDEVYVTGSSSSGLTTLVGLGRLADQTTVAYEAATGEPRWVARLNSTGYDSAAGKALLPSADGEHLYVLGALTHNIEVDRNFYAAGLTAYRLDESA